MGRRGGVLLFAGPMGAMRATGATGAMRTWGSTVDRGDCEECEGQGIRWVPRQRSSEGSGIGMWDGQNDERRWMTAIGIFSMSANGLLCRGEKRMR